MGKKIHLGKFKRGTTETLLEAVFTAPTDQEAMALANQWMLANVPHEWPRELVHSAQVLDRAPAHHGKKGAPDECTVTVKLTPPHGADLDVMARVRKAISEYRAAHS